MVIKPQKSTVFAWFFILSWIPAVIYLGYRYKVETWKQNCIIIFFLVVLIMMFTKAFSTYYLNYEGITQKCFFVTKHFGWDEFKFIGKQRMPARGRFSTPSTWIRCSTMALPENLTVKQFEKMNWPILKTMTIEWHGDQFYQEFLSYCGGERDIRD